MAEDAEENMGLMDVLNGMQNGPRGASPSAPATQSHVHPACCVIPDRAKYNGMTPWGVRSVGTRPLPSRRVVLGRGGADNAMVGDVPKLSPANRVPFPDSSSAEAAG